jgi:hypothetical protein
LCSRHSGHMPTEHVFLGEAIEASSTYSLHSVYISKVCSRLSRVLVLVRQVQTSLLGRYNIHSLCPRVSQRFLPEFLLLFLSRHRFPLHWSLESKRRLSSHRAHTPTRHRLLQSWRRPFPLGLPFLQTPSPQPAAFYKSFAMSSSYRSLLGFSP